MRGLLGILSDWLTAIKGTIVVRAHRSRWTTRVAFGGGTVLMATALAVFWLQTGSDLEPGSASLDGSGSGEVNGSIGDPDLDRTPATESTDVSDPTGAGPAGQTEPSTPGAQQDARSGTAPTGGPASGSDAGGAGPAGAGVPGSATRSGAGSTPTEPASPTSGIPGTTSPASPTTSPAPSPTSTAPPPPPPPPGDEPPGDGSQGLVGGLLDAVGGLLGGVVG